MDPFKLNFITASSFRWSKGFHFSPKINEPEDMATITHGLQYHRVYLQNKRSDLTLTKVLTNCQR